MESVETNQQCLVGDSLESVHCRRFRPLKEEPCLFRKFADLSPIRTQIERFANEYGLLGLARRPELPEDAYELKVDWRVEIQQMAYAVILWEALQACERRRTRSLSRRALDEASRSDSMSVLRDHIDFRNSMIVFSSYPGSRLPRLGVQTWAGPDLKQCIDARDYVGAGRVLLMKILNRKLAEHGTAGGFCYIPENSLLVPFSIPISLIGCLWSQFALSVAVNQKFSQCRFCDTWIAHKSPVYPEGRNEDATFCCDEHKAKQHREERSREGSHSKARQVVVVDRR